MWQALALGAGFASDLMGRSERRSDSAQAMKQFNMQMNESVQRRVADAKKAGIHPLFALGANVGASPTLSYGGGRSGMSGTTNAIGQIMAQTGMKAVNEAQAAKDEAIAGYYRAMESKLTQDAAAHNDVDTVTTSDALGRPVQGYGPPAPGSDPLVKVRPVEVSAQRSPGTRAGAEPLMIPITLPGGREITVPNPDTFEELLQPSSIVGLIKAIGGMTDQEIFSVLRQARGWLSRHGRAAGVSDQQIMQKIRKARNWVSKGFEGGSRHYGSNW